MRLIRWAVVTVLLGAFLFALERHTALPMVWAYLAVVSGGLLRGMFSVDPGLVQERRRPGPGGTDRRFSMIIAPLWVSHWVVAMLDVGRFYWSAIASITFQLAALAMFGGCLFLVLRAMAANRFFSSVVRIQTERGHHLISAGPYRYVRHPGYVGLTGAYFFSGLALGSAWSLIPAMGCVLMALRRTALEDRFLREHLDGYTAYMERVRYRLVPGVW